MQRFPLEILASYFQFVIKDSESKEDLSDRWNSETVRDMFIGGNEVIAVGTVRDLIVPVTIRILEKAETLEGPEEWDQVIDYGISVPSGEIVIMGVTDHPLDATRIKLQPGRYNVRIFYGSLESVSPDGLNGDDHYRIDVWKGEGFGNSSPVFIKRRLVQHNY